MEKMVFSTIYPSSDMNSKEGLYLFITLMWGILILVSDYSYTNTLIGKVWMIFGFLLIFTAIYVWISYCIYSLIEDVVWNYLTTQVFNTEWAVRLIDLIKKYFSR